MSIRKMTGPWWAQHFVRYTADCVDYILRSKVDHITLYDPNRERKTDIKITRADLEEIRRDLETIL